MGEKAIKGYSVLHFIEGDLCYNWVVTQCFEIQLLSHNISERRTDHIEKSIKLLLLHLSGACAEQEVSHSDLNISPYSNILHRCDYSVH